MRLQHKLFKSLMVSLKENSSAYGFSISITGGYAILTQLSNRPSALSLFLGAGGASAAFIALDLLVLAVGVQLREDDDPPATKFIARVMTIVSVGTAMSGAYAAGYFLTGPWAWLVGGFLTSFLFLLVDSLELALVN